ncbi:ABC transporter ATP-binding protein [Hydrogenophaga sp. ANAO-22]|jgi:putative spermidine/putrescine transport system ATP-binding protein|uniref:ABC transporter ATP-binding protein n=1 Tax=Hydrogenophaga sp. ANAO-22 TaxID=3166645 RepID=UPI0036D237C1
MAFLEIRGLTKSYAGVVAVDGVDLDIEQGELVCLLGPSGCGKTTTLQMIAGFVEASAGRITLSGRDLLRVPVQSRGIGIVFQSYALFPHMTVEQNVAFGLEMRGIKVDERSRQVKKALDAVRLTAFALRYPKQLSGGQRQRVALARAMVIDPPLLLLDEPLSNLDAQLREEMQVELRRVCRDAGLTAVMVTHDQAEALALGDKIAVLNNGRLEQVGPPAQIYDAPRTTFVAGFIGKMNLWNTEQWRAVVPGVDVGSGAVGLRPQVLRFCEQHEARLQGRVVARVYQGDHLIYVVNTQLGEVLVQLPTHQRPAPGEQESVGLTWSDADLHRVDGKVES